MGLTDFEPQNWAQPPSDSEGQELFEETLLGHFSPQSSRIWVVDDDVVTRLYIAEILKNCNYSVEAYESALSAWERLQSLEEGQRPNVIISDWTMPELSGVDFCHRLRRSPEGQLVYFILLTARSALEDRVSGLNAGADEFLVKPVDPQELQARVRAGLRLQQLTQALAQANRQLRARNELLESLSLTDPLTGALNRRALDQALPHLFQQVGPREKARYRYLCLLMMDIDHFKQVNDTHGHYIGDCVLQAVVGRLQNCLRPSSLLYRYGGEEFVCITPVLNPSQSRRYAEYLRRTIANHPIAVSPRCRLPITLSIGGVVMSEHHCPPPEVALQQADQALYEAKKAGRNRVLFFPLAESQAAPGSTSAEQPAEQPEENG